MNLALDHFADNPIIDELVRWPPAARRMLSVRACNALFRKPFIEVCMEDGKVFQRHFARDSFAAHWAEACVILQTLTTIETISEFSFAPAANRGQLERRVLEVRDECIAECAPMYQQGMYAQFLMQFGEDCRDLPPAVRAQIESARAAIAEGRQAPGERD